MRIEVKTDFPAKLGFLFEPARYKVAYGGRGGAKSWGFADALLIIGAKKPTRILCARETQKSIAESVHQLLQDRIIALGLSAFYEVVESEIRGKNGSQFIFAGLKHNVNNIKSKEGIDIVWVEEAQTVSKVSWETLIPTIRKEKSEIWVSFNPELDTDETYKRFVSNPPPGAVIVKINWNDNPWFPDVLRAEKDHMLASDPDAYLTVWEGHCRQWLDGAIYANELRKATDEGRICRVPYVPGKPVHTFWDLGWSDKTSIWFAQKIGLDVNLIDFYQNRRLTITDYLRVLQGKPYVYGTDYLPHDADSGTLASDGRGVDSQLRAAGRKVIIVPRVAKKLIGITAVRTVFPMMRFDAENTADGLNDIRRYRYKVNAETGQWSREPDHDDSSHAADALETLARSLVDEKQKHQPKKTEYLYTGQTGQWMGA